MNEKNLITERPGKVYRCGEALEGDCANTSNSSNRHSLKQTNFYGDDKALQSSASRVGTD